MRLRSGAGPKRSLRGKAEKIERAVVAAKPSEKPRNINCSSPCSKPRARTFKPWAKKPTVLKQAAVSDPRHRLRKNRFAACLLRAPRSSCRRLHRDAKYHLTDRAKRASRVYTA
jgi:hypothetical protein